MRASGVYYHLTDSSQQVAGSTVLSAVVFLQTIKGPIGKLIEVNSTNFDEVIGYDLTYNQNYYGLKNVLKTLASVKVYRMNHGATIDNCYLNAEGNKVSASGIADFEVIKSLSPSPVVAFGMNQPGKWCNYYAKLYKNEPLKGSIPVGTGSLPDPVVLGTMDTIDLTTASITLSSETYTELKYVKFNNGSTLHVVENSELAVGKYNIINSSGEVCGILDITGTTVTLDSYDYSKVVSGASKITYDIAQSSENFNFGVYEKNAAGYSLVGVAPVTASSINVVVNDVEVFFGSDFDPDTFNKWDDYFTLANGTNGVMPSAGQLDLSCLDKSNANILCMNGITDISLINAIAQKADLDGRSLFCDAPMYTEYADIEEWQKSLFATQYLALGANYDIEGTEIGETYIWPSMKYLNIYASMMANYGNLNYPPAGYTTGNIAVTRLPETDFGSHRDELKTNKINYMWVDESAVMWEQRTRYADESDLSYISTVFILRDLKDRIMSYMKKKPFRFTTPDELLSINTNLTTILDTLKDAGFLAAYDLIIPSFAEAQRSRENEIHIPVQVMKDGEVWDIWTNLRNDMI